MAPIITIKNSTQSQSGNYKQKNPTPLCEIGLCFFLRLRLRLLTDTEFFLSDDCTVAIDILTDKVVKKATTLTYKCFQCASCLMIFVI